MSCTNKANLHNDNMATTTGVDCLLGAPPAVNIVQHEHQSRPVDKRTKEGFPYLYRHVGYAALSIVAEYNPASPGMDRKTAQAILQRSSDLERWAVSVVKAQRNYDEASAKRIQEVEQTLSWNRAMQNALHRSLAQLKANSDSIPLQNRVKFLSCQLAGTALPEELEYAYRNPGWVTEYDVQFGRTDNELDIDGLLDAEFPLDSLPDINAPSSLRVLTDGQVEINGKIWRREGVQWVFGDPPRKIDEFYFPGDGICVEVEMKSGEKFACYNITYLAMKSAIELRSLSHDKRTAVVMQDVQSMSFIPEGPHQEFATGRLPLGTALIPKKITLQERFPFVSTLFYPDKSNPYYARDQIRTYTNGGVIAAYDGNPDSDSRIFRFTHYDTLAGVRNSSEKIKVLALSQAHPLEQPGNYQASYKTAIESLNSFMSAMGRPAVADIPDGDLTSIDSNPIAQLLGASNMNFYQGGGTRHRVKLDNVCWPTKADYLKAKKYLQSLGVSGDFDGIKLITPLPPEIVRWSNLVEVQMIADPRRPQNWKDVEANGLNAGRNLWAEVPPYPNLKLRKQKAASPTLIATKTSFPNGAFQHAAISVTYGSNAGSKFTINDQSYPFIVDKYGRLIYTPTTPAIPEQHREIFMELFRDVQQQRFENYDTTTPETWLQQWLFGTPG